MYLKINDEFHISNIREGDQPFYVKHLNDVDVYRSTLAIPSPYPMEEAERWVKLNIEKENEQNGVTTNWAIRNTQTGELIGGVGYMGNVLVAPRFFTRSAEIGYWLAKPYWGKGLMTDAVRAACKYGFEKLGFDRITAGTFDFNRPSQRVLEKAGFIYEGLSRRFYFKEGKPFDACRYALLAEDLEVEKPRPSSIVNYRDVMDPDTATYPGSNELLSRGSPLAKKTGLTRLGIHHEMLYPGRRTSWPHAESIEDEFVYVLEGRPHAWIDGHMYKLKEGDAVGSPAGTGICHTFINNTDSLVRLLVVGEASKKENKAFYAFHTDRNEQARKEGWLWEDPPRQPLGDHDGIPDRMR